jgi:predicted lipoprotein with Yx(FWY)xxD motif
MLLRNPDERMRKMTASKMTRTTLAAVGVSALLLIAGCGSSSDSSSSTSSTVASTSSSGGSGAATIDVADNDSLGSILTDSSGNTVYLFEKDEAGGSACTGECASVWSPVTTDGAPDAGKGADASQLGTIKRDDGSEQVTYAGHPLYLYQGDTQPGDTNGNGLDQFGAEWYALTPDGANAEGDESGGEGSSSSDESTTSTSEDSTDSSSGTADYGY